MRITVWALALLAVGCSKKSRDAGKVPEPPDHTPHEVKVSRPDSGVLAGCQGERPPGNGNATAVGDCKSDADCTQGKNGRCHFSPGGGPHMPHNSCSYDGCFVDADCETATLCMCNRQGGNHCGAGNCRGDADCGPGGSCAMSGSIDCWSGAAYFCRTPHDKCKTDADCPAADRRSTCTFQPALGIFDCHAVQECPVG